MDILNQIVDIKRNHLEDELAEYADFKSDLPKRSFTEALRVSTPSIIAEVKYASPAKGNFGVKYSPAELAKMYQAGGANAISVLACEPYFNGSPKYVYEAKQATDLPVLWKDFIFDIRQIELAVNYGADAILLICAVIKDRLPSLLEACENYGIIPVVEVADIKEAELAKAAGAEIILINNRNLRTMQVDLEVSKALQACFAPDTTLISASGISKGKDIIDLQNSGINIFLVGESISRSPNPVQAIRELIEGRC